MIQSLVKSLLLVFGRRARLGGALALLAMLSQIAAGLAPMPMAGPALALGDLCLAANSPLARHPGPTDTGKTRPGSPAQACQICLTLQLAGHFLPPSPGIALAYPVAYRIQLEPGEAEPPAAVRHASTAPRGPPAVA